MTRLVLAVALAVGLLASSGAVAAAAPAPDGNLFGQAVGAPAPSSGGTAVPAPTPDSTGTLTLTNQDTGMTVQVTTGQTVVLSLAAGSGMQPWQVGTPDPNVLAPAPNTAATTTQGVTQSTFQAVGAGTTQLTASDRPSCAAGEMCPQFIIAYQVTVDVSDPNC